MGLCGLFVCTAGVLGQGIVDVTIDTVSVPSTTQFRVTFFNPLGNVQQLVVTEATSPAPVGGSATTVATVSHGVGQPEVHKVRVHVVE